VYKLKAPDVHVNCDGIGRSPRCCLAIGHSLDETVDRLAEPGQRLDRARRQQNDPHHLCDALDVGAKLVVMTGEPRTFTVVLEPAEEGGFIVTVPALPELGTQGDTYDEAMANAREAIELVIEDRLSRGEPIPADVQPQIERITIAA
jgi:antitoxin HicB